jgi:hypothetical protein
MGSGSRGLSWRRWQRLSGLFLMPVIACLAFSAGAGAAPGCEVSITPCPPFLNQVGELGAGAGQFRAPGAIAADPNTGHVFVADTQQNRINEFDSHGTFVKAWGWAVLDGVAPALQVCTADSGCTNGTAGSGPGQFDSPGGLAVDGEGNVWSSEIEDPRLQKFTPAGEFVLMVGGEVNKTKVQLREEQEANSEPVTVTEAEENLCTAASGDVCGKATSGNGQGQFNEIGLGFQDPIEVGPDGVIYVGDFSRIEKFDKEGTYEGEIPLPGGERTESLAIDPAGRIYVISIGVTHLVTRPSGSLANSPVVREVGPGGEELGQLNAEWEGHATPQFPGALAADADGNIYVTATVVESVGEPPKFRDFKQVVAFDDEGNLINFEPDKAGFDSTADDTLLSSIATNVVGDGTGAPGEVFVGHLKSSALAYVNVFGVPFDSKMAPPSIEEEFVEEVGTADATVEALIKPGFDPETVYQVEYGTGTCSSGGCESLAPLEPAELGGGAVNSAVATGPISLTRLLPATTYHYRFRAENEATDEEGTGPVFGDEGTFRTYATPVPVTGCPNAALRGGASAQLPDCRAYELVSPLDKAGGEAVSGTDVPTFPAEIDQTAPAGGAFTYSSLRAFANPEAAPLVSQYIARRDPGAGWSNEAISPPRESELPVPTLDSEFTAFSEDLANGWLTTNFEPPLAEGAIEGYRNLYRRDNESGSFEAQCPVTPPVTETEEFRLEAQGSSADGSHLVFRANDRLTPDALAGVTQVYECVGGSELRLVGVLPGGEASPGGSSAGTADGGMNGFGTRVNDIAGAVSVDGSRIFWTAAASGVGPLYARIDGTETVQIAAAGARFRTASPDGSRVLYTTASGLFEAQVGDESATSTQLAGEVLGFVGASEDTQLAYFVSKEDLDGGGPAQTGNPNLYIHRAEGDSETFIGQLSQDDAKEVPVGAEMPVLTPTSTSPFHRSSRVTPDGLGLAFTSTAPLTGFDNTDQQSGKADTEVFLYDAGSEELRCLSCNPSGARPTGANLFTTQTPYWVAATIPGWENQSHAKRALAPEGNRVFFEALDRLALGDTNDVKDVYQWEAPGTGSCTEASSSYSPANGGCIDLISSGNSPQPSEFIDASTSGDDVFLRTAQSLWAPDPGWVDIYDARVNGGFAPPPPPKPECEGEACQPPGSPPPASTPGTATFVGPGNVVEQPKKARPKHCRKGTHKVKKRGKVRCVKNAKKKSGRGRAAR